MTGIQLHIQRLIRKQRFTLNTVESSSTRWRQGKVNLDYRITWVNDEYWNTKVNIMVRGEVEDNKVYTEGGPQMVPAIEAVHAPKDGCWDSTYRRRSAIWGEQYHKQIRRHIRSEVTNDLRNFFKLIGIEQTITVDKVNFEK